ncbi:MAG TPA: AMP-binding protein [Longimicrobiales bacterium]|nr:AMP-binding protein [Longimicrobiales bacterium]
MNAELYPTAPDPIGHWARLAGGRTALVDPTRDQRHTYAELDAIIDRHARVLLSMAVGPGDIVATLAGTRTEHIALFHACGRVGAALSPLNWRLSPAELTPILRNAQPKVLFGEARFRGLAETAMAGAPEVATRCIDVDEELPSLLRSADASPRMTPRPVSAEDAALVLYTSGSTGRPKGAVLPHRQILFNALATTSSWELGPGDVALVSTPLFHTGGWNVFATPLWQRGGTVVLFDGFDAAEFLNTMAQHGCTVALTVPTQLLMLTQSTSWGMPLPALRSFFSGGASLPASLGERVRAAGYNLREGYGLTECGPNCFAMPPELAPDRPGVVGWPVQFLDARVVDDAGRDAEDGAAGELWLRGPQRFSGYLRDSERTAEAITADGWLRTGDIVGRGTDGAFSICGRAKEMYISGGENVYPAEVEAALAECDGVAECAVIGVPDEKWGEVGRAFVVRTGETGPGADDLMSMMRRRLAGFKTPRSIIFVEALPRLGSGKIDRTALRKMVEVANG